MDDNTPTSLNAKQALAILHLAAGSTAHAVAKIVDVTEQTISVWKSEPAFEKALLEERKRVEDRTRKDIDEIARLSMRVQRKALEVVEAALNSKEPGIAFQAAKVALRKT